MNQQNNCDDNQHTDIRTDLPLTSEQSEQVKAGEGTRGVGVGELQETIISKGSDTASVPLFRG
jgi:hypothetical protein